jgi:aspartate beta-hydroxylase
VNAGAPQSDIRTLLARADDYVRKGDPRAAVSFYQAALNSARNLRAADARIAADLKRAQAFIQDRGEEFQDALNRAVNRVEPEDSAAAQRIAHAMDLLQGKREIYPQQPSMLYYPYLAQRQFFERDEFPWAAELEAAAPLIRDELLALLSERAEFRPYIEDAPDRPRRDFHGLNDDPRWTAFYLWKHGELLADNSARCPGTMDALAKVPLSRIGSRTPSVFFSRLEPGAKIPPHTGMLNCRLICHLPLIVPAGCWLRVGNERREWTEGELLIFDDSIEHEASNPSAQARIVLIFDIWRPELSDSERQGISAMFDAIDQFRSARKD